jgi:hypothetical protein
MNVRDQILLWESERKRVQFARATLFELEDEKQFRQCVDYAREHNGLQIANETKLFVAMSPEVGDAFKAAQRVGSI